MSIPKPLLTPPQSDRSHSPKDDDTLLPQIRWWNINLPKEHWTENCPEFLLGQCAKNISIMSTHDEDYKLTGWDEAKQLIKVGQIDHFGRTPTELRRYSKYTQDLKVKYGSVLYYIQHERLKWPTIKPSGDPPFTNPSDYKVLYNDWPYALESDIKHLVVWTKFVVEEAPGTEQLTTEAYNAIENFVVKTFCSAADKADGSTLHNPWRTKRENVIWFKNWARLRSVHALEHIHVLLYRASPELLQSVTQGDSPMSEKIVG